MKSKTKTLTAIAVAAVLGGGALVAGITYANHRDGGFDDDMDFLDGRHFGVTAMDVFETMDTDGDGSLSQVEIDELRNARHAAHDANSDGNLDLEEFAGLWQETTRPLTVRIFQMLDTDGDAIITRAEYDLPLADIVRRLDRDGDGGLSMNDRWRRHGDRGHRRNHN